MKEFNCAGMLKEVDTIVAIWREQIGLVGYVPSLAFTYSQA